MKLSDGALQKIKGGNYNVVFDANGGTGTLSLKVRGMATAQLIPDADWSADTIKTITLPTGEVQADLTGTAAMFLNLVED